MDFTLERSFAKELLARFSGEYRELFFERATGFSLRLLNGKIESPTYRSHEGFSILSRTGADTRFSSYPRLNRIKEDVASFVRVHSLSPSAASKTSDSADATAGTADAVFVRTNDPVVDAAPFFERLSKLSAVALRFPFVESFEAVLNFSYRSYAVTGSTGAFWDDVQKYHSFYVILSGRRGDVHEEVMEKITGTNILSELSYEAMERVFEETAAVLDRTLSGTPAPSGEMDVVIGNESGGTIIHEAVGHGLEADLQNSSVYRGKIGEKVASDAVTVVDDPTLPGLRGYYALDHEGNPARKTVLIENGTLVSYLHQNRTAELLGARSTGHARRESYAHDTLVRMGSTYLAPGTATKEAIIASVKDGLYVSRMGGGQVNTVTGDFVFKVTSGFRIRDGKIAENVRGANISGNGPKMLRDIRAVGNDLVFFDGGTCGKWPNQMPVSDATPTVLVRLKVTG